MEREYTWMNGFKYRISHPKEAVKIPRNTSVLSLLCLGEAAQSSCESMNAKLIEDKESIKRRQKSIQSLESTSSC